MRSLLIRGLGPLGLMLGAVACGGGGTGAVSSPHAIETRGPTAVVATATSSACPADAGLPVGTKDHGAAVAADSTILLTAEDSFFAPTCETGVTAGTVSIKLRNAGSALHNFSVPGQSIDVDVAPGTVVTITVTKGAQPLQFFCKYHRISGMVGVLLSGPS